MSLPKFCITVPIGAYHPFLRDCLTSLAIQTPRPQVALVDASGDPRVAALADEFDDLLTYRHHGPDQGQTDAIAKGWAQLDGDVLGWLNGDDVLFPNALRDASLALHQHPDAALVYGHSQIVNDHNSVTGFHWNVEPPSDRILSHCNISQPSCFFRRAAYDAVGGLDRDLHYTMDWDLWVRLFKANGEFAFIDTVMSKVLWSSDAKTGGFGAQRRKELSRLLKQNLSRREQVNSYIGFASHHLFEYVLPAGLRQKIWRRNTDGGHGKFGLQVSGGIPERATIPLVHYNREKKDAIRLVYDGNVEALTWRACGKDLDIQSVNDNTAELKLPRGLQAGIEISLTATRNSHEPFYLTGVDIL